MRDKIRGVDILLVDSPACIQNPREHFYSYYERQGELINLGLALLSSSLRRSGLSSRILDANLKKLDVAHTAAAISSSGAFCVGFSLNIYNLASTLEIVSLLRRRGLKCHITAGGAFASSYAKELLSRFEAFDSIVCGEGETAAAALVRALFSGGKWKGIPGVAYRNNQGRIVENRGLGPGLSMDDLPFPDRYDLYGLGTGIVELARGCYGNCSFCCLRTLNEISGASQLRRRSLRVFFDELEYLYLRGCKFFRFQADNFFPSPRAEESNSFVREFCREIRKRRLNLKFSIACRVNDLNEKRLKALKEVGLTGVFIGVESVNKSDLLRFNKNITLGEICGAVNLLIRERLQFDCGYILFNPWTTPAELRRSANFMIKVGLHHFPYGAYRMKAHPHTEMFRAIEDDGLLKRRMFFSEKRIEDLYLRYRFKNEETGIIWEQVDALYLGMYSFVMKEVLSVCLEKNLLPEVKDICDLHVLQLIAGLTGGEDATPVNRELYLQSACAAISSRVFG
jgi:radical SAM superfamily enzyme YgiQ (UPF0313 family)